MFIISAAVYAQESDSSAKYHPFLSDTFHIGLGVYRPTQKRKIGVDLSLVNVQDSLDATEDQTTAMVDFRWRYTENWSFQAQYWATSSDSRHTVTEPFEFNGQEFLPGSFVGAGLDTSIARLFWGRSFFRKPSTDWGVGLGLHWMEMDVFVEGEIVGGGTGLHRESASAVAPLPNLGIWYMYSWSPKWVLLTRLDWLEVTFEEFSGSMFDASVGVNYQMSDHFGVGLALNAFKLDVEVDSGEWKSGLETSQYGPRLNVTWNW